MKVLLCVVLLLLSGCPVRTVDSGMDFGKDMFWNVKSPLSLKGAMAYNQARIF